jgi:hypothetical protein
LYGIISSRNVNGNIKLYDIFLYFRPKEDIFLKDSARNNTPNLLPEKQPKQPTEKLDSPWVKMLRL